jgi:putative DNA primase/helicase
MMDAEGRVIGLSRRFGKLVTIKDGKPTNKAIMHGGKQGLSLPAGWRDRPSPLFVVEGPTDAAGSTSAGLACVGHPTNSGGVELLAKLLRDWPADRDIVIVGENDRKPDGEWPGRAGAESVARWLAARLGRRVFWTLPPAEAKDVRDWLTADARSETPWPDRGAELAAHLIGNAVVIDPPEGPTAPNAPDSGPNDGPDNPHRLAAGFLDSLSPGGPPHRLRYWRGEFHHYQVGAYHPVPDDDLRAQVVAWVRAEFLRLHSLDVAAWQGKTGDKGLSPRVRPVTMNLIGNVLQALRGMCLLSAAIEAPSWIDGATGPDPSVMLPVANGLLDLEAATAGRPGCLLPASPSFFTPTAATFSYDPSAPEPVEWLKFLATIWPNDPESVACLQEWFGYLLTPDTRQQKILFLLGPKRGGKGTVARVLRELVGLLNMVGPTLGSLATNFGLSPLLGKSVAVIADARLSGRVDAVTITERLLSISGEDALTIDRKHRDPVTGKLNVRFVILSNELPRLGDSSGAFAGRLILLRLTESFFGKEDPKLFDRLRKEMPGILLWAIDGWRRLQNRGRFVQPASGAELIKDMENLSSPVGAFVRDRCIVGPGCSVEVGELYQAWRVWCDQHGRKEPGTEETFGRDLRAAVPSINRSRPRTQEGRISLYTGI